MIELTVPGRGVMHLEHLVCDVNGTLALDGVLLEGVAAHIAHLRSLIEVHLITADTHGRQQFIDQQLDLRAVRLQAGSEAEQKAEFVRQLGAAGVVAIGQGANDAQMLASSAIGICVLSQEGAAVASLLAANIVVPDIHTALDMIENPLRMIATLRI